MKENLREIVYSPNSEILNFRKLLKNMGGDLKRSRELAWRLFVRNISAQYRQSFLGYAWAFLPPLITSFVWIFLNSQRVFQIADTGMPYPVFVICGTVFWQTFTQALSSPIQMVKTSKSMLTKVNFPREALILAGVGQVLFNFAIRAVLLILVFYWYGINPSQSLWLVPIGVLSLIVFGTGLGLLLTPLGILYNDVGRALTFVTQIWFFLTPVIYPAPNANFAAILVDINPITPLLMSSRDWLVNGSSDYATSFILFSFLGGILLFVAWFIYRVSLPHLISRMSA